MQKEVKSKATSSNENNILQLIVFRAGSEEFSISIDAVREVIKVSGLTPIPNAPSFIRGLLNVRGEIVTAIDIKSYFSLADPEHTEAKHIVVTKDGDSLFGLVVDEVIEVLRIKKNDIKPPPNLISQIHEKYVKGVISHDGRLIILLDIQQVLSRNELLTLAVPKGQMINESTK